MLHVIWLCLLMLPVIKLLHQKTPWYIHNHVGVFIYLQPPRNLCLPTVCGCLKGFRNQAFKCKPTPCGCSPLLKSAYRCVNKRLLSASCCDTDKLSAGSSSPLAWSLHKYENNVNVLKPIKCLGVCLFVCFLQKLETNEINVFLFSIMQTYWAAVCPKAVPEDSSHYTF